MKLAVKYDRVCAFSIFIFLTWVFLIELFVLKRTEGVISYPLDDAFIHMALAKNLAFHGNWGINPYEFGSASSSIFYTLLLTVLFLVFRGGIIIPLLINVVAGVLLLITVNRWLRRQDISERPRFIILLLLIVITPLPILAITGMEHTLQCLFDFLFIFGFAGWWEDARRSGSSTPFPTRLFVYSVLVTSIRFEGMFLVGFVCLILLYHRKIRLSVLLGIVALSPVILFGIFSVMKGSYFLPNSVLLKSESLRFTVRGIIDYLSNGIGQKLTVINHLRGKATFKPEIDLLATQQLLIILPVGFLLFRKYIGERISYVTILIILAATTVLHLWFASTGWFYRYEAYLIFCSVAVLGVLFVKYGKFIWQERGKGDLLLAGLLAFALFFPFVFRSSAAFDHAVTACVNINQQQYRMGQFLKKYYPETKVGFNDAGAISYYTGGDNLDLWGLGNIDVARSKKSGKCSPEFLYELSRKRDIKFAIVYDSWFSDTLLRHWDKVATWSIKNNVICGDSIVTFYAVDPTLKGDLKEKLQDFGPQLPESVGIKYY